MSVEKIKEKLCHRISELEEKISKKSYFLRQFENKGHKVVTQTEAELGTLLLELKFLREVVNDTGEIRQH